MAVQFDNVSKSYKIRIQTGLKGFIRPDYRNVDAIKNISFKLTTNRITGLIGENGSGKSTLIKLISGILSPDTGDISVLGDNPFILRKQLMHKIGIIFGQRSILRTTIPVKYTYEWLRDLYGLSKEVYTDRLQKLSELLEIKELIDRPPRELSLGQRRKCDLLAALLHGPELLLLDEPTIGLDYNAKDIFRDMLKKLNLVDGVTVLISSHDLNDLEQICDEFLIIKKGEIKFHGNFEDLHNKMDLSNVLRVSSSHQNLVKLCTILYI